MHCVLLIFQNNYYAGGAIIGEIYTEKSTSLDYTRLLVQGAWKHHLTSAHKAFFYLLVPRHYYVPDQHKICPSRWIISCYSHKEIDCQFQNSKHDLISTAIASDTTYSLGR
jgi:hypothetical protein